MAFGNLKFDTLTTSDAKNTNTEKSIDTSYLFNGIAKAYVEGSDSAGLTKSFNISSGSDDGTGDYSYTFTNNMDSGAMVVNINCAQNANAIGVNNARSASSFGIKMFTDAGSLVDRDNSNAIHGDLA